MCPHDEGPVVIVGGGLAALRCALTLRELGHSGDVTIVGEEPHLPYERPALSKELLLGSRAAGELVLGGADRLVTLDIHHLRGERVVRIDPAGTVHLAGGTVLPWQQLVLATGSRARQLPGTDHVTNVHTLRTLDDAELLRASLAPGTRLAIVGCGFVGAEVASTARALGASVTVVEVEEVPFGRTLGVGAGRTLLDLYRSGGVDVRTGARIERLVERNGAVVAIELADGGTVGCDVVLASIGAIPNDELFHDAWPDSTAAAGTGIPTDADGRTAIAGVYACGDVAAPERAGHGGNVRIEHWTDADHQGRAVARAIVAAAPVPLPAPYVWSDQFGHRLQLAGSPRRSVTDVVVEADIDQLEVHYLDGDGELVAVLAANQPRLVAGYRRSLASASRSRPVPPMGSLSP